jgi:hypothetical protein
MVDAAKAAPSAAAGNEGKTLKEIADEAVAVHVASAKAMGRDGLTAARVEELRAKWGWNELPEKKVRAP